MDIIIMILSATIILGILVFIHEGGHYVAARIFGVRVTEFMIGLPGPSIGVTLKGTRFGVTAIPLGGYARICGMGQGEPSPYIKQVLAFSYEKGTVYMEDVALALNITEEEALKALDDLTEWGSLIAPTKKDKHNVYRTPEVRGAFELGQARVVEDTQAFYESEYKQQYLSLPFWKRSIILLSGVIINLVFAILLFILLFSVIGADVTNTATGETYHATLDPLRAVEFGFQYIGMVVSAVIGLFNPATAADTVSNSSSIVGIAIMSKSAFEQGLFSFVQFMAMISVSLGIMNLLPIPPLDGGRFLIEIIQKISGRRISEKVVGYVTTAGMLLFIGFLVVMVTQDVQRIFDGFWDSM